MAEGKENAKAAAPQHTSKGAPEGMRLARKTSGIRWGRTPKQLDGSAEVEARNGDMSHVERMVAVEKLNLLRKKLKKMKEDHDILMTCVPLTQKKLERVKG